MVCLIRKLIKQNKKLALHTEIETRFAEKTLIWVINYSRLK
jgi:hypothetical protein